VKNQHTNVILINASQRFDLSGSSCVNEEGSVFARKLSKIAKNFENVSLVSIELQMSIKGKKP
jgi:hypothetical protein